MQYIHIVFVFDEELKWAELRPSLFSCQSKTVATVTVRVKTCIDMSLIFIQNLCDLRAFSWITQTLPRGL